VLSAASYNRLRGIGVHVRPSTKAEPRTARSPMFAPRSRRFLEFAEEERMFFSEEKNQKTFDPPSVLRFEHGPARFRWRRIKSLLVLFFRKEHL
jgi:hypothetical protein